VSFVVGSLATVNAPVSLSTGPAAGGGQPPRLAVAGEASHPPASTAAATANSRSRPSTMPKRSSRPRC